jgi:hypothetical protein
MFSIRSPMRTTLQHKRDRQAWPVTVRILVPEGGFQSLGRDNHTDHWLHDKLGRGEYALTRHRSIIGDVVSSTFARCMQRCDFASASPHCRSQTRRQGRCGSRRSCRTGVGSLTKMNTNQFGLRRDIPNEVKRSVRQRCGFGCVICGRAVYTYEHFSPEFKDAKFHDPAGITLLCGSHQDEKTAGYLSGSDVASYNDDPYPLRSGGANFPMLFRHPPQIILGKTHLVCEIALEILGEPIIWFSMVEGEPPTLGLNARIRNEAGDIVFEIIENEWRIGLSEWDVETTAGSISIRSAPRKISLIMTLHPPDAIEFSRMTMLHRGYDFSIGVDGKIRAGNEVVSQIITAGYSYGPVGIRLHPRRIMFGAGYPSPDDFFDD